MRYRRRVWMPVLAVLVLLAVLAAVYAMRDGRTGLEQARAECESRGGQTELLPLGDQHICYEVTVLDDGWRLCDLSLPYLAAPSETMHESEYPCGNTGPRSPSDKPLFEEVMIEEAPADCESAQDWYADYLESVAMMNRFVARAVAMDAVSVQAWLSTLGHSFEQNGRRAEAAQASCETSDTLGIYLAIAEARAALDETYKSIVGSCLADGIHDCTALTPTPKEECESDPEFVYVLDALPLENWPHSAASGCSLRT